VSPRNPERSLLQQWRVFLAGMADKEIILCPNANPQNSNHDNLRKITAGHTTGGERCAGRPDAKPC
jgi:hypothetical protein